MGDVNLSIDEVHNLIKVVLLKNGCNEDNARAIAANMTMAERDEARSHGLFRLPAHVKSLRNGKVNGQAKPTLDQLSTGVIRVHGDLGYTPLAHEIGLPPLAELAWKKGIAALSIVRTIHFGALWQETSALAERGLVSMAFTSSPPYVATAGGKTPLFGTNPMSFAWPRKDNPPMVFDQASAAMARGEIMLRTREGKPVGDGIGLDRNGNQSNDPKKILEGAQLPFGGYKGAAIALMIDLLAGPLIGEVCSFEAGELDNGDGSPAPGGELILAFSPTHFGSDEEVEFRGERLFAKMLEQDGVRLPGDRRLAARERTAKHGILVPEGLYQEIIELYKA